MAKITYQITGMTCGSCVKRVQAVLAQHAQTATVTLEPPIAVLDQPSEDVIALNAALAKVGNYQLVSNQEPKNMIEKPQEPKKSWLQTYQPLLLIFGYIVLVTLAIEWRHDNFVLHRWMPHFMAGFFLVFSFFKFLDLKGFAQSYAMYDLAAKKIPAYGFVYPFIELGLGIAYLIDFKPLLTNWIAFVVMTFSAIGVILAVANKQKIRCACLGAVFNLPMTTVTIIEDIMMAAMAAWMLI